MCLNILKMFAAFCKILLIKICPNLPLVALCIEAEEVRRTEGLLLEREGPPVHRWPKRARWAAVAGGAAEEGGFPPPAQQRIYVRGVREFCNIWGRDSQF